MEDGPGVEILSQLWFLRWLVALQARGYHAVLRPIITGWLKALLEFCDGFCG